MSRHSKGDLQQMQSLPLEAKILMTQRRMNQLGLKEVLEYIGVPYE